ncbi:phosphatase PAP2 family protein [bacterium]|nr:phosphatase PAP2 family protein [bacterium]
MDPARLAQLVEMILGVATVMVFLWVAIPGVPPWRTIARCAAATWRSRPRQRYLAACLSILAFNYLYLVLHVDCALARWIEPWPHLGFTPILHLHVEGDAVARVQAAVAWLPLTYCLGFAYVVVFPLLVLVSILVYDHHRDRRHLAMVLAGYALNFLIVLPFYLFCPILECFEYYLLLPDYPQATRLLLDDISPAIMHGYRTMSGVDNCFPSFHTSLAVTVALVAAHAGRARFARLVGFFAVAIVVSTIYLGIHWFTDVAAGLFVGWLAYRLARVVSGRWASAQGKGSRE